MISTLKFSILMVISETDNVDYLYDALNSVTIDQKLKADEFILIKNGKLDNSQNTLIKNWMACNDLNIKVIDLPKMQTLSNSLNTGLKNCSYDLIARMDPDDISLPERFFEQIKAFEKDKELSVCGTLGKEFSDDKDSFFKKKLPLQPIEIKKFSRWRNPLIHPSVMFKKEDVLSVGGYPQTNKAQDYLLWTRMIANNYKVKNLENILIKVRTDDDLIERRGFNYFLSEVEVLRYMYKDGSLPIIYLFINIFLRFFVRIAPKQIKTFFYKLRPSVK